MIMMIWSRVGSDTKQKSTSPFLPIIISAVRRPLLDIGLTQSSPRRSVLRCPHPAASSDRRFTSWSAYQRCVSRYAGAIRGPFRPTAVSPPRNVPCPLPHDVCNRRAISVTLVLLRISSFFYGSFLHGYRKRLLKVIL
jgi:hypothetical protein